MEYLRAIGIHLESELQTIKKKDKEPMQPLYEAFSNAWESIFDRFGADDMCQGKIDVQIVYTDNLFSDIREGFTFQKIRIVDNGEGLTEKNFVRMQNLRDCTKGHNNKGTGRVQYVHFFRETGIISAYRSGDNVLEYRNLTLSKEDAFLKQHNTIIRVNDVGTNPMLDSGTIVEFSLPYESDAAYYASLNVSELKESFLRYFLVKLCEKRERLPHIRFSSVLGEQIQDSCSIESLDIPIPYQEEIFDIPYSHVNDSGKIEQSLSSESFHVRIFKNSMSSVQKNKLFFVSKGALAQSMSVDCIRESDSLDGSRYSFFLSSDYFDKNDSDDRGNVVIISAKEFKNRNSSTIYPEEMILMEDIKAHSNSVILKKCPEFKEKEKQRVDNIEALKSMFLLDEEIVSKLRNKINNSATDEEILFAIYQADDEMVAKRDAMMKQQFLSLRSLSPEQNDYQVNLRKQVEEFTKLIPLQNRTNLTKYIARRKLVLQIFEMILNHELKNLENSGRIDEGLLHNLIFQQSSADVKESDLWLLDDQYVYFKGCSEYRLSKAKFGDRYLLKQSFTEEEKAYITRNNLEGKEKDARIRKPDVLLYPEEGKCIIIEFKAPDVEVSEHLEQINRYAMMINNLSNDTFHIHAFYGYLIGENINYDYIQEAESSFKQASNLNYIFRPSYEVPGRFGRLSGDMYTEIIKYSDILQRAKLRNRIFIEKMEAK